MYDKPQLYGSVESARKYDECRVGHPEVIQKILSLFPLPESGQIADIGCGTGNETVHIANYANQQIWGIDKSHPMLALAKRKLSSKVNLITAEAGRSKSRLPFRPKSFRYIFSSFTHHHMKSSEIFFSEIRGLLEPGGRFVLLGATLEQAFERPLMRFFPQLVEIESRRYLPRETLIESFWRAGFVQVSCTELFFETRDINKLYLERARKKELNSALYFLSEQDFQEGLEKIESALDEYLSFKIERTVLSGVRPHDIENTQERETLLKRHFGSIARTKLAPLKGGVMNRLFSLEKKRKKIVLKQGTNRSSSTQIGIELQAMSAERTLDEYRALKALNEKHIWNVRLPMIHKFYESENLLVLENIADSGTLMSTNKTSEAIIENTFVTLSEFLALQHSVFRDKRLFLREDEKRDLEKWKWMFHLRTTSLIKKMNVDDDFKKALHAKAHNILDNCEDQTLVNTDLCPKNVFVYPENEIPGVFDFEFCSGVGDPIYDIGFLVGHMLIMAILHGYQTSSRDRIVHHSISSYENIVPSDKRISDLVWYAACTILYRRFGDSKWPGFEKIPIDHPLIQLSQQVIRRGGGAVADLLV